MDARFGLLSSCAIREQKMWGARATLRRQFAGLDCGVSLGMLARVHQACIPEMAHVNMLRSIIGARKSTPQAPVFLESCSAPLSDSWLQQSLTFWNNLAGLLLTSLYRRIAFDSVAQALLGTHNWARYLVTSFAAVGHNFSLHPDEFQGIDPLLLHRLLAAQRTSIFSPNEDMSHLRICPSEGIIVCTYARWFQKPAWVRAKVIICLWWVSCNLCVSDTSSPSRAVVIVMNAWVNHCPS